MAVACQIRYLNSFSISKDLRWGKKARSHLVPVEMPLFKKGWHGGREKEGKKRARSRFSFDVYQLPKAELIAEFCNCFCYW